MNKNTKGKEKKEEPLYLQNISYDYIENKEIKGINFNYVLNHMFFKEKNDIKRKSKKINNLKIPYELKDYKNTIQMYCKNAKLDIISKDFKLKLGKNDKLIVGLGHQNIMETSITIHKIYGVPYIPGQTLKGIFRNYIYKLKDKDIEDKELLMKVLFRENEERSGIHFFDSYPEGQYTIDTDVMNVHHQNYYSGKGKVNDEEKLIPINFYVIRNTIFPILFALEEEHVNKTIQDSEKVKNVEDIKKAISNLVYEAYTFLGIGAKTNVGYGFGQIEK